MPFFFSLAVVSYVVSTAFIGAFAQLTGRRACEPLPLGSGYIPFPDTAESFQSFSPFSDEAITAVTPVGYVQAYSNSHTTYDEPSQFVHYKNMDSYNVAECAAACNDEAECNAFTIFFERAPTVEPGPACADPPSTTLIKCDMWAGTILPSIPLNSGQMRQQFRSVMAGSNAYVKDINTGDGNNTGMPSVPVDWVLQKYPNGAAIEAPRDCHGVDTYMGMRYWLDGRFDTQRCIDACDAAGEYDVQGHQCHFVNTYMQRKNNVPIAQHCAMFSQIWPSEFATNFGQRQGDDEIEISGTDSYAIYHAHGGNPACFNATDAPPHYPSSSSSQPAIIASETAIHSTPAPTPTPVPAPSTLTTMVSRKPWSFPLDVIEHIPNLVSDSVGQTTWIPDHIQDHTTWLSDLLDGQTVTTTKALTSHVKSVATVPTPSVTMATETVSPVITNTSSVAV